MVADHNGYTPRLMHLRELHSSMRHEKIYVQVFPFEYNKILCQVLFQTDSTPYKLSFVQIGYPEILSLTIITGYKAWLSEEKIKEIKSFFQISGDHGYWKFMPFIQLLDSKIPKKATKASREERAIIAKTTNVQESEKTLFMSFSIWENINKKKKPGMKHCHRRPENLEKTKLLYPDLYELVKDKDISVNYTDKEEKARWWTKGELGY